jgi:hypothetical protein
VPSPFQSPEIGFKEPPLGWKATTVLAKPLSLLLRKKNWEPLGLYRPTVDTLTPVCAGAATAIG